MKTDLRNLQLSNRNGPPDRLPDLVLSKLFLINYNHGPHVEGSAVMPRARNIYNSDYPYHLTGRTNDGLPFPCELEVAWEIYKNALWFYSRVFETRILAFVMMNNHFHLLMSTPKSNLSEFMKFFMKRTSDEIRSIRSVKNHLYGDRYYPSLVSNQKYFETVLKYIYQNPIRANICNSVLEYPYSSLNSFLGNQKLEIPIFDDYNFFDNLSLNLKWLEKPYCPETTYRIKKGLKLQVFKPDHDKSSYLNDTLLQKS